MFLFLRREGLGGGGAGIEVEPRVKFHFLNDLQILIQIERNKK